MLVGENGIITQAQRADELTTQAQQKEAIELAVASVQAQGTLELDKTKLKTALQSQLGDTEYSLTENGDGSFLLQIAERSYYIDSTGEVIAEENMIAIGSAEELKTFRDDVNSGNTYEGKYVYLIGDITLDINEEWEPIGLYLMENSTPDAETNKPFSGIFDGKGYEINGIYINTTDKAQGLFGLVEGGKITNLGIGENNTITGGNATAGIVGYAYNNSVISNCFNNTVVNLVYGGGIVGCANVNTIIVNCHNKGKIIGTGEFTGGVAGYVVQNSIVKDCYNIEAIKGTVHVGGVVGTVNTNSNTENCYNIGIVNGENMAGGITGYLGENSSIKNCYTIGNINGQYYVGGICGFSSQNSLVRECYNTGDIEATDQNENGNSNIGGLIGMSEGNIENCYNTGTIIGVYNNIGGIVGLNRGKIENCYNIGQLSGSVENKGGITGNNNLFEGSTATYVGEIYNSYTLSEVTDKIAGINNSTIGSECSLKNSVELKQIYTTLGESFKQDENNINQGYPVLTWQ